MTRYCCPDCEEHPVMFNSLECDECGGGYKWVKKGERVVKND